MQGVHRLENAETHLTWEVEHFERTVVTRSGRHLSQATPQTRAYRTVQDARHAVQQTLRELQSSGYTEVAGPMAGYASRFSAMVDELREDDAVHVANFHLGPPASGAALAEVERFLGVRLAPAITTFFKQCNGLTLNWVLKDEHFEKKWSRGRPCTRPFSTRPLLRADVATDRGASHGTVCIGTLEDLFAPEEPGAHTWFHHQDNTTTVESFDGKAYPSLDFHKAIRVFDYCSFYRFTGLLLWPGHRNLRVLTADDHGAHWNPHGEDFEGYMEDLLVTQAELGERGMA